MDFELTDDQRMIQESVRRFALAEVKPGAKARDHHGTFAKDLLPRLTELGLLDLKELGMRTAAIAIEELARQDASLAFHVALASFGSSGSSGSSDPVPVPISVAGNERLGLRSAGDILVSSPSSRTLIAVAAIAVGLSRAALEDALTYAQDRKQFGKAIAEFQAIQWMLADIATETDAARMLVHRAADLADRSAAAEKTADAQKARVFASETAVRAAMKAIQIHGGIGFTRELPVERYCRDAKMLEIWAGGSDRMRTAIAGSVLVG